VYVSHLSCKVRGDEFMRGIERDVDDWDGLVQPTEFFTRY
jgi:hypothetical protein